MLSFLSLGIDDFEIVSELHDVRLPYVLEAKSFPELLQSFQVLRRHGDFFSALLQHEQPCPPIYLGEMFVRSPRVRTFAKLLIGDVVLAYILPFPPHLQDEPPAGRMDDEDMLEVPLLTILMLRAGKEDL